MRFKHLSTRNAALIFTSVLLAICLAFGILMLPKTALAADGDETETYSHTYILGTSGEDSETVSYYENISQGWSEAVSQEGKVLVQLAKDWEAEEHEDYITSFGSDNAAGFSYGRIYVPATADVVLDLNGNNIDRKICDENGETPEAAALDRVAVEELNEEDLLTRQGNVIHVEGTLEITDSNEVGGKICGGYGSFLINGNKSEYSQRGGGVSVVADAALVLSGNAVISGNIARWGGGVYIDPYAKFTMTGGVIENNYSTQGGGGVLVSGKFTMTDGSITGNEATTTGGGVYVNALPNEEFLREDNSLLCIFEMCGGSIEGNTAKSHGGGVANSYIFEMSGGSIEGNTATTHAGGVYNLAAGTFTMTDGSITGNTANSNGGGVYNAGAVTMEGGSIVGNEAKTNGGGVYSAGTFTMTDGSIAGNEATTNGGGVYNYTNGTFTMTDGSIIGNTANSNGGGVYNNTNGTFEMTGGIIGTISDNDEKTENTAKNGGGVYNGGTITLTDGLITGNEATSGGGVYNTGTLTIDENGSVTGNTANNGGGVYNNATGSLDITGNGSVTGNTANNGGGVYNGGTITVVENGSISQNTTTTIYDEANEKTTGGNGGGVYNSGKIIINGGTIFKNEAGASGGGVYNGTNGVITLISGNIGIKSEDGSTGKDATGNEATVHGGGVYNAGSLEMSGGSIAGNKANSHGGGAHNSGTINLTDGSIEGNEATNHGGGVYNTGTLTIDENGSITGNTANSNGGGVYNYGSTSKASLVDMKGGSIEGNKSRLNGGGIYNNISSVIDLSGDAVIKNNTLLAGSASNLYLLSGQNLIVGELTEYAYIAVKVAGTNTGLSTTDINYASLKYLHDDAGNDLALNADGQLTSVTKSYTWSLSINGQAITTDVPGYTYTYGYHGKDNVINITCNDQTVNLYKVVEDGSTGLGEGTSFELTAGTYYAVSSDSAVRFNIIIEKLELNDNNVTISGLPAENEEFTYTGEQHVFVPNISIAVGNNEAVVPNYSISYSNNVNAGTATLTLNVIGTDNYSGYTLTREFIITASDTAYEIVWQHRNGDDWETVNGNELTVTFNNADHLNDIRALLVADGSEVEVYSYSAGLTLKGESIIKAGSYSVTVEGNGNYTLPENQLTVTVDALKLGNALTTDGFTGEDAQTRRLWLLHIGESETASQLRSSATYYADGQVVNGTEEYYYARYRENEELSILLNDAYTVNFEVNNVTYSFTIAQLKSLGVNVRYSKNAITCNEASGVYENKENVITTTVTLSFGNGCSLSGSDITITKEWAIVTINNGLLNGNGVEYSISDFVWGSSSITLPVPEHGNEADFQLVTGETEVTKFTVHYNEDGSQTLSGDDVDNEEQDFADFVNSFINNLGCGTYRLTVKLSETSEGDEAYYPVERTFQFTVNPYELTENDVVLSVVSFNYNGGAHRPNIGVPQGATYTVEYYNNINAGTATAIVTGTGNYTGSVVLTYEINKATNNAWSGSLEVKGWTYGAYSTNEVYFRATATYGSADVIYTVTDSNGNAVTNLAVANAGTYTVTATIIGTDNYAAPAASISNTLVIAVADNGWAVLPDVIEWSYKNYSATTNIILGTPYFGTVSYLVKDENGEELTSEFTLDENGAVPDYVIDLFENLGQGTYKLVVSVGSSGNYGELDEEVSFVVSKAGHVWEETPSIMAWVKGEYNETENGVAFIDIFGNTASSENVDILIYDANLDESNITDDNVIYKVVNGEVLIDNLANADIGHYILKVTVNETDNYFGAEKTFNFQIFAPEGLAWWAWLLIIVGILGVIATVFIILHEKGVLQMLTGKIVIAMRTKMTVDATIAAVRANMVAERSAKTRAEAQKRDRIEEMRKAREEAKQRPADEQAAALEEQANLTAQRAERMQKRAASMQKRADKMRAQVGEAEAEQEATATDETDSTQE